MQVLSVPLLFAGSRNRWCPQDGSSEGTSEAVCPETHGGDGKQRFQSRTSSDLSHMGGARPRVCSSASLPVAPNIGTAIAAHGMFAVTVASRTTTTYPMCMRRLIAGTPGKDETLIPGCKTSYHPDNQW